MTRDYSQLWPSKGSDDHQKRKRSQLEILGWKPFFSQQLSLDDLAAASPVRVTEVHRTGLHVLGEGIDAIVPPGLDATVGDWLLYDANQPTHSRLLERTSLFERRAAGTGRKRQLIAANVDTVFIVSSCNRDFNVARLERYVAMAFEAEVTPVILLTKADLCDDPAPYVEAARAISDRVTVEALNALSDEPNDRLAPWCKPGQTVAFLGSSGVGKSTLVNTLLNESVADTAAIRDDDSKGRHTTSRRQLHFSPDGCGCWIRLECVSCSSPMSKPVSLTSFPTSPTWQASAGSAIANTTVNPAALFRLPWRKAILSPRDMHAGTNWPPKKDSIPPL